MALFGLVLKDRPQSGALRMGFPPVGVYTTPIYRIRYTDCATIRRVGYYMAEYPMGFADVAGGGLGER